MFERNSFAKEVFRKSNFHVLTEIGHALENDPDVHSRSKEVGRCAALNKVKVSTLHAPSLEAIFAYLNYLEVVNCGKNCYMVKDIDEECLGEDMLVYISHDKIHFYHPDTLELNTFDNMYNWKRYIALLVAADYSKDTEVNEALVALTGMNVDIVSNINPVLYVLCGEMYAYYKTVDFKILDKRDMLGEHPQFKNFLETAEQVSVTLKELQKEYAIGTEEYEEEPYTVSKTLVNMLKMLKFAGMRKFMLRGEAGCGKTTDAKMLSRVLKVPLFTFTCSRNTKETDLISTFIPEETGYKMVSSSIVEACKIPAVCEIQEPACIDKQSVLTALNGLLDEGASIRLVSGETIKLNPDTIFVFTTNADYVGCRPMNESVLSRMDEIIDYPFLENEDFVNRAKTKFPQVEDGIIRQIAKIITSIRRYMKETGIIGGVCGMRECFNCIKAVTAGLSLNEAVNYTILGKVSIDADTQQEVYGAAVEPYIDEIGQSVF